MEVIVFPEVIAEAPSFRCCYSIPNWQWTSEIMHHSQCDVRYTKDISRPAGYFSALQQDAQSRNEINVDC